MPASAAHERRAVGEQERVEVELEQPPEGPEEAALDLLGVVAQEPVGHEPEPAFVAADDRVGEAQRAASAPR